MLTPEINFVNFKKKLKTKKINNIFKSLINENNSILQSLSKKYQDSFDNKFVKKFKKSNNFRLLGMGGSTLGSQAIYQFLKNKVKKKFDFIDNLQSSTRSNKTKYANIIISKSGNTIETLVNANILIKKSDKNIFITERKTIFIF